MVCQCRRRWNLPSLDVITRRFEAYILGFPTVNLSGHVYMRGVLVCINVFVKRYIRFIKVIVLIETVSLKISPRLMVQATWHPDIKSNSWRYYVEERTIGRLIEYKHPSKTMLSLTLYATLVGYLQHAAAPLSPELLILFEIGNTRPNESLSGNEVLKADLIASFDCRITGTA